MAKATRLCDVDGCDRKHEARGFCKMHWKQNYGKRTNYAITCDICGVQYQSTRPDGRFCSDDCKALAYMDENLTRCSLPPRHPVRELIAQANRAAWSQPGPLRVAFESGDWPTLSLILEAKAVKVDGCWLWPTSRSKDGYGKVVIAGKHYGPHRLMAMATKGDHIPSHMPVHHVCAEPLCINPTHLQVITPQENTAEMLERRHYQQRIADLERALASIAPHHALLISHVA